MTMMMTMIDGEDNLYAGDYDNDDDADNDKEGKN